MGVKFSGKIVFGLSLALNTQLQFRKNIGTYTDVATIGKNCKCFTNDREI